MHPDRCSPSTLNACVTRFTPSSEQPIFYSLKAVALPAARFSISLLCTSTAPSVSLSELCASFFVAMTNLETAFTMETDGFHFSFGPSRVFPLRSFQLFQPPSLYERSPHRAPILGRSNFRSASQVEHSSTSTPKLTAH